MLCVPYEMGGFNPPAPVMPRLLVYLKDSPTRLAEIKMLVDTGANITSLPLSIFKGQKPEIPEILEFSRVHGFTNDSKRVPICSVKIQVPGQSIRQFRVILTDKSYGALGRDILNLLNIHLDGPRQLLYIFGT